MSNPNSKQWTEQELDILQSHYQPGGIVAAQLSQTLLPRFSQKEIAAKAYKMAQLRSRWSEEEEEWLEAIAETMPFPELVRYWQRQAPKRGLPVRSYHALRIKLYRSGYTLRPVGSGWSAKVLARGMGIATKNVFRWIKDGKLKAQWAGVEGSEYLITPKQLRNFCAQYPGEFSNLRMDGDGFAWLLQAMFQ